MGGDFRTIFSITLPAKWEEFLKGLSDEHGIDMEGLSVDCMIGVFLSGNTRGNLKFGWILFIRQKVKPKIEQEPT
jgi:hypothetical protein